MSAPLTDVDLVQLRAKNIAWQDKHIGPVPADIVFTCDGCGDAPTCEFVFDPYNTDGDCLAEK